MKLHERDKAQTKLLTEIEEMIRNLKDQVNHKIAQPYGDGSYSNMINASTDVLPALRSILDEMFYRLK